MSTAALSVKLCYPVVIEERDQRHIGTLSLLPSSCWTGTSSGSFARKHETSGGSSWNLLTAPPTLALLVSLAQAGRKVVEPVTKHFNRLRGKNPLAHLSPPSTRRSVRHCLLTELFNLSVAGFEIPAIWKNSSIVPILKVGKPGEQHCEDLGAAPSHEDCEDFRNAPLPARL